jgi:transposase-like protein
MLRTTAEFKAKALKLEDNIVVAATAREFKLNGSQLYNWRAATKKKSTTITVT